MPNWGELLSQTSSISYDELRNKYISKLSNYTGRNTIIYYSGWLNQRKHNNVDINDNDMTGFMNAVYGLDATKGLDLILHTPGGSPTATEGIVYYLHRIFGNNIRVIVPHMAMSAGTMLACASKKIIMGSHSFLGPVDPQINGLSAYNITKEFREARDDISKSSLNKPFWDILLSKYSPNIFYFALDSIELSNQLLREWLKSYMFSDDDNIDDVINAIVNKLNANNMSHSRHFGLDVCKNIGLKIEKLETDETLNDLVLGIHHSAIITLDRTKICKIIENQNGKLYMIS